jgi:hypothetical protein
LEWVNRDSDSCHEEARTRLQAVFEDLVGLAKDDLDFDSCYPIYVAFLRFAIGQIVAAGGKVHLEIIWRLRQGLTKVCPCPSGVCEARLPG